MDDKDYCYIMITSWQGPHELRAKSDRCGIGLIVDSGHQERIGILARAICMPNELKEHYGVR